MNILRVPRFAFIACLCATLFAGCAGLDPEVYRAERPLLAMERYFDGTVDAWGVVTDRSGKVVRRFTVVMRCRWDGDRGTLDEAFSYSDGKRETRVWSVVREAPGHYTGSAADVVGTATGRAEGNALNWRYTLDLAVDRDRYHIQFDDWMFLIDDDVLINRAVMSKLGIRVGEVLITFRRRR
jgi:hypothetical protein